MKKTVAILVVILLLTLCFVACNERPDTSNVKSTYIRVDEDTVLFGVYPQSDVTDATLKDTLNNLAGELPTSGSHKNWTSYGYYISGEKQDYMWYIDIEEGGEKYRGVYFTSYRPSSFDAGSSEEESDLFQSYNGYLLNVVYWFKFDPVSWTILEEKDGTAIIICDMVIDSQAYQTEYSYVEVNNETIFYNTTEGVPNGTYANNYAYSTIRRWLNDTFYNTAFNNADKGIILTTTVDNSAESTAINPNKYVCENTEDKIYLLSYQEAKTYLSYNDRYVGEPKEWKKSTAYAQAQGIVADEETDGSGWWLRSPNEDYEFPAVYLNNDYIIGGIPSFYNVYGVVPVLRVSTGA